MFGCRTDQRAVRTEDLLILANPGVWGGPEDVELERQLVRAMFSDEDDRDLSTALIGLYPWLAAPCDISSRAEYQAWIIDVLLTRDATHPIPVTA